MTSATPKRFREVMAYVPTSVVVVTATGPDEPLGLAIGSFVSVSLEPLLIGFFPANTSSSWSRIRECERFCVNVLGDDQTSLSRQFAKSGGDKFAGVDWHHAPSGAPVLDAAVVWLDCALEAEIETGDHALVLGRVLDLDIAREAHALIFHRGDYTSTAATSVSDGLG